MKIKRILSRVMRKRQWGKGGEYFKNVMFLVPLFETAFLRSPIYCFAAPSVNSVTKPLTTLKTLVITIIGAIGIIILAKEVMEFATAYRQSDNTSMASAVKGIVGGFLMAGISGVLALLGYK